MGARLRVATLVCVPALAALGCGGATEAPPNEAGADARPAPADDASFIAPIDAADSGPPAVVGSGTCTLTTTNAAADGGLFDAGGVAWTGTATYQTVVVSEDLPGVAIRCLTTHEELRLTVAMNQTDGVGTLQTYWGLEGTGSGKAACTVQLSAAPWVPNTIGVVALYTCAPMDMTWGGRVSVTGTVSAK